jgi:hypothetical protein
VHKQQQQQVIFEKTKMPKDNKKRPKGIENFGKRKKRKH